MIIRKIALNGFRNYEFETVEFAPGTNVISGQNAQGKTNLLEAVYMLSCGRSFRTRFDRDIIEGINRLEDETAANTGMTFVIAVNYGGRDEITRAVRHMMMDCQDGKLVPEDVTEQTVASYLDTADIPDPDLLIRTSGEIRLSNYLLWQLAYSEIYITDCLWPDFNRDELIKAIEQFNQRDRRFGGVKA